MLLAGSWIVALLFEVSSSFDEKIGRRIKSRSREEEGRIAVIDRRTASALSPKTRAT